MMGMGVDVGENVGTEAGIEYESGTPHFLER
jgi:hypothetical protein